MRCIIFDEMGREEIEKAHAFFYSHPNTMENKKSMNNLPMK